MKKKSKNIVLLVVILAIIGIAVGYSALQQTLVLTGTAKTKSNEDWKIRFGEISGSGNVGATDVSSKILDGKTSGEFSATLIPGGVATYTVTVVNEGTINAQVGSEPQVSLKATSGDFSNYVDCRVEPAYDNSQILTPSDTHTYTVTLTYQGEDLPDTVISGTATVEFDYVQEMDAQN